MGCSPSSVKETQNIIPVTQQENTTHPNVMDKTLCGKHGGKILTKYNEQSNKLYCDLCTSGNRTLSSDVIDITRYINSIQFKQKKIKTENEMRSKKRDVQSVLADVNDNLSALEVQKNNLVEEVKNFRSAVVDIINHLCSSLCERVTFIYEDESKILEKRRKNYSEYLHLLNKTEQDDTLVKNPDALTLLNWIEMEKTLLNMSRQASEYIFVDVQLKLHDNIPLRKLLNCDQTASTLGEVFVLRNTKVERPCTKDLIVHDISDVEDTYKDSEIVETAKYIDHPQAKQKQLPETSGQSQGTSRSKTPHTEQKSNQLSHSEQRNFSRDVSENRRKSTPIPKRQPEDVVNENNFDCKAPLRSKTPRLELKSRKENPSKSRNTVESQRESLTQSVMSNFSITTPSSIQFGTPVNHKKFFERNSKLLKTISLPVDKKNSDITSSVILPNGNVILCDRSNRKLWYFDPTFRQISSCLLDHEPYNVCLINDTALSDDLCNYRLAVTFPKPRIIQIINASMDELTKVDEVRTDPECWGIGCMGKFIVFSTERGDVFRDVGDYRNYKWRKYRYTFQKPVHLTVDKEIIFVCNWGLEEVSGNLVAMYFDDRGKNQIKFSYANRYLKRPASCSVDQEGNIYICDAESAKLHLVSSDGSQFRVLDTDGGHTGSWQHIMFVPGSDYFVMTEAGSNLVYVFQMI